MCTTNTVKLEVQLYWLQGGGLQATKTKDVQQSDLSRDEPEWFVTSDKIW